MIHATFISPEQADEYVNVTGIKVATWCSGCGAPILKFPAHVRRNRRRGVYKLYCNRSCQAKFRDWEPLRGEDNPRYNGSNYRQKALDHYGAVCRECGYDREPTLLWVHHKDFGRSDHSLENLIVLCIRCHLELHVEHDRALQK